MGMRIYLVLISLFCATRAWENFEGSLEDDVPQRSPKLLLNPFSILGNQKCMMNNDEGRCYGEVECLALAGNYGPFCEGFKGLCCLFYRTCNQRTSREVSYFQNTQYPLEDQNPNTCTFKVVKKGEEYCGLRMMAQIPKNSQISQYCPNTNLYIEGAGTKHSKPMPLCKNGRTSPIDYAIDIGRVEEVRLHVNSSSRGSAAWKIKVTQIKCSEFNGESVPTSGGSGSGGSGSGGSGSGGSGLIGDGGGAVFPPVGPVTTKRPQTTPRPIITTRRTTRRPIVSPPAPPTLTTSAPSPVSINSYSRCGRKGGNRNSKTFLDNYLGINRMKYPTSTTPRSFNSFNRDNGVVVNSDGVAPGNPFLKDLIYDGPDVSDSVFEYWKGTASPESTRVTYGQPARKNEYRWQVAMFVGSRYHCGGSIIGDKFILTAAHCVVSYKVKPSVLKLSLGDYDLSHENDGPYIEARIQTVRIHPSYSRSTLQNDLAVLKLTKRIEYSERVGPVCLPTTDIPTDNKQATITGWGRDQNKKLKKILQELTSDIVTNAYCSKQWQNKNAPAGFIVATMMCMDSSQGDSCNGDSGGPSVLEYPPGSGTYVQVGIVSFGSGSCTDKNLPGVYTRVSKFRDWIRQQMY